MGGRGALRLARTGTVLEEYPVYAIHQDAMAPMALFALSRAGGPQHELTVTRGMEWPISPRAWRYRRIS